MSQASRYRWRDLRDLFLLPILVSVLPLRLVYASFRARFLHTKAYDEEARTTDAGAARVHHVALDRKKLVDDFRFLKLLSNADMFRMRIAPDAVAALRAALPAGQRAPMLVLSMHWGSAVGLLRECARLLGPTRFVIAPLDKAEYHALPLRGYFAERAMRVIERACGAPRIITGQSRQQIIQALQDKHNVCLLVDVPAHQTTRTSDVAGVGGFIRLPSGFAELAVSANVPVLLMAACPSSQSADHSHCLVDFIPGPRTEEEILTRVGNMLAQCIAREPGGWHMWQHADEILIRPKPSHADA